MRRLLFVLALLALAMGTVIAVSTAAPAKKPGTPTAHQLTLRASVDTPDGQPRTGRDPAAQKQTSLAEAAGKPAGNGMRGDQPAASAVRDHKHDAEPEDVIDDPGTSGVFASGCVVGYGVPGEECLPTKGAAKITCIDVRKIFPRGITVTGQDQFRLDRNGNAIACDQGDR